MNQKINKLKRAAIFAVDGDCGDLDIPDYFAEKFAELIVKDCASIYEAIDNGNKVEGTTNYVKAIMKRYGIN